MFIEYGDSYDNKKKSEKVDYGSNYFYYFISLKHKIDLNVKWNVPKKSLKNNFAQISLPDVDRFENTCTAHSKALIILINEAFVVPKK